MVLKLHTEGKHIKDSYGRIIYLKGVNKPSFEWDVNGVHQDSEDDWRNMASWGCNVVRLNFAMNWMIADEDYRKRIDQAIAWAEKYGLYTILSCQWVDQTVKNTPLPEPKADWIAMWQLIADRYKDRSSILFDIYNEPHHGNWFNYAQDCINAIRAKGANQLVLVSGTTYARDVTQVVTTPLSGGDIIYSLHLYYKWTGSEIEAHGGTEGWLNDLGWKALLDNNIAPVIVAEFQAYIPAEYDWMRKFLTIMRDWGMSYTAWAYYHFLTYPTSLVEDDWVTPTDTGRILIEFLPTPISPIIAWWNRRSRLEKTIIISSVPLAIFGIYSSMKGRG